MGVRLFFDREFVPVEPDGRDVTSMAECPTTSPLLRRHWAQKRGKRNPHCRALFGLLGVSLAAVLPYEVRGDGVFEILGALKSFREGTQQVFDTAKGITQKNGNEELAKELENWSGTWMKVMGLNTGLTGLAKDFVLNYLGRSNYHDNNGPLLDKIKAVGSGLSVAGAGSLSESEEKGLKEALLAVCAEGKNLFEEGGAIRSMLQDFESVVRKPEAMKALMQGLKNDEMSNAFSYLAGARPY